MSLDLQGLTKSVCFIAREAAIYLRSQSDRISEENVLTKGLHDYVTHVDRQSEQMLVSALTELLPEAGFLAEEGTGELGNSDLHWIIDPLDGTTNYIHGLPLYCISIALARNSEVLLGVVLEVGQDECFYAWKGGGTWLNGGRVYVSFTDKLDSSLLATGFPYHDYSRLSSYLELFSHFMRSTRGIRRLGSAAADLAYVACGRFDGFYEYGLNPWDVAAGLILVEEAGGRNSDFSGGDDCLHGKELISSNSLIFDAFLADVKHHMAR